MDCVHLSIAVGRSGAFSATLLHIILKSAMTMFTESRRTLAKAVSSVECCGSFDTFCLIVLMYCAVDCVTCFNNLLIAFKSSTVICMWPLDRERQ